MPMHSLGHTFVPAPIHAGGLRYHGVAPLISRLVMDGLVEPRAYPQLACYESSVKWARTEGFITAPETSHALAAVVEEAEKAREEGKEKTILFNWSGHGLMDLLGYDKFFSGELEDYALPEEELQKFSEALADFPRPNTG
jgi:tryptophan synthase beta chain